ncbi:16070_t:CDS:2, partial [Gigaspora rosea]
DFIVEEKNSIRKKLKYDQSEITTHFQKIESIPETRILENHVSVISNAAVYNLLLDEDFYIKYHQISVVLKPIKELNCLEARTANLADVFIGLVKLAASREESCEQLLLEMRSWQWKVDPYNIFYNSTREMPMKWWLSINIDEDQEQLLKLANTTLSFPSRRYGKIRSYYLSNSDKELRFYGKDLSNDELYKSINASMVTYDLLETSDQNIDDKVDNLDSIDEDVDLKDSHSTLNIADLVNLVLPEFSATGDAIFLSEPVVTHQLRDTGNMNYDSIELACRMALYDDEN